MSSQNSITFLSDELNVGLKWVCLFRILLLFYTGDMSEMKQVSNELNVATDVSQIEPQVESKIF